MEMKIGYAGMMQLAGFLCCEILLDWQLRVKVTAVKLSPLH